jgi:hypothetical protein
MKLLVVYRARDLKRKREVAIKILSEAIGRFRMDEVTQ